MKITGYRLLRTFHDWGRPVGDANGYVKSGVTEVPLVLLDTDEGVTGIGMGAHHDIDRLFPALEGEDPRAVTSLYDAMLARGKIDADAAARGGRGVEHVASMNHLDSWDVLGEWGMHVHEVEHLFTVPLKAR